MPLGLIFVFLNTSSLHKNINNVKANYNICAVDIILLAEATLITNENNNDYLIPNFEIPYRNDQIWSTPSRPPQGVISYNKTNVES